MTLSYIVNEILGISGKNKNIRFAEAKNVTVNAGQSAEAIVKVSMADYPYHYVLVKCDSSHNFTAVERTYVAETPQPLKIPGSDTVIIDASVTKMGRGMTEWIKAKGELLTVAINNLDTENAHTYNVYVMGVK